MGNSNEIADHFEIARVEHPACGIAMAKPHQDFSLKRRHPDPRSQLVCWPILCLALKITHASRGNAAGRTRVRRQIGHSRSRIAAGSSAL
jgi:hypothetical protein